MFSIKPFDKDFENLPTNFIVHTHNAEVIPTFMPNRQLIIVTRDLSEIVASHIVAQHTGIYSISKIDQLSHYKNMFVNKKITIESNLFREQFKKYLEFYVEAFKYKTNASILNYNQAKNTNEFCKILNLDPNVNVYMDRRKISVYAMPVDKWQMIENVKEIKTLAAELTMLAEEKSPDIFIKDLF